MPKLGGCRRKKRETTVNLDFHGVCNEPKGGFLKKRGKMVGEMTWGGPSEKAIFSREVYCPLGRPLGGR